MIGLHPGFILIIGAILVATVPDRKFRQLTMVGIPALAALAAFLLPMDINYTLPFVLGNELQYLKVDKLSWIFAFVFSIMALLANIYALHNGSAGEVVAGMVYPASALGVVLAGDWLTFIVFWELMAISSVFLIWFRKTKRSLRSGFRYILVHLLGGQLLLAGVFVKALQGDFNVATLVGTQDAAFWLVFLGVAVSAAIPPLHSWVADAYPEGSITGSVFLSAFTTKAAVYALLRIFPGYSMLITLGVIMALYGIVYAILENDIRKLLSYHIVSQLGFMVVGVGIGTQMSMDAAVAHAFNNVIYKPLLFMGAGAVIYATGYRKLTDLGGIGHRMPWTTFFFIVGALAISGVPLFNGYLSKPMIATAAERANMSLVVLLIQWAGMGTFIS
ncbi:MAG: Na+/H+ antiporter subunit D, partial [Clostridia bacterium]|nr:Na+/H+ antiporter subunit D [Clostridia bacterium]